MKTFTKKQRKQIYLKAAELIAKIESMNTYDAIATAGKITFIDAYKMKRDEYGEHVYDFQLDSSENRLTFLCLLAELTEKPI